MTSSQLKFLFVSKYGEILDIANTIQEEGNSVKLFIEDKPSKEIGDGFVPKVKSWKNQTDWADVIVLITLVMARRLKN